MKAVRFAGALKHACCETEIWLVTGGDVRILDISGGKVVKFFGNEQLGCFMDIGWGLVTVLLVNGFSDFLLKLFHFWTDLVASKDRFFGMMFFVVDSFSI